MTQFEECLRRVITANNDSDQSIVIVDGGPSAQAGTLETGGLFEIWHEAVTGMLDPRSTDDMGATRSLLSPDSGMVKVRWFVIHPQDPATPPEEAIAHTRERFAAFGAEDHLRDQTIHPAMHQTETMDVICLLQGDVSLVLDTGETRIKPGQVVIQRGTSHAWRAHDGPALLLAVLIDRPLAGSSD